MTYTATAAVPDADAERAVSGLRGQLRMLAANNKTVPDWAILRVTGPDEVVGRHGVVWYEWKAVVEAARREARDSLISGIAVTP